MKERRERLTASNFGRLRNTSKISLLCFILAILNQMKNINTKSKHWFMAINIDLKAIPRARGSYFVIKYATKGSQVE